MSVHGLKVSIRNGLYLVFPLIYRPGLAGAGGSHDARRSRKGLSHETGYTTARRHRNPVILRVPILVQQWKTCNQIFSFGQES